MNGIAGDGRSIYSTTGDLFKWDQALYTEKLVSKTTLNEAFTPVVLNNDSTFNYGFGWHINTTLTGKKLIQHCGNGNGMITWISREIDDNNTKILLTNHSNMGYVPEILNALECILHDREVNYPKMSIAVFIGKILLAQGVDSAITLYHRLKKNEFEKYHFDEWQLKTIGYNLIHLGKLAEAIEVFKLNVESFPESSNTYDSLGKAYMENGQKNLAIKNYEKSLELNPKNTNAIEMLKKINEKK